MSLHFGELNVPIPHIRQLCANQFGGARGKSSGTASKLYLMSSGWQRENQGNLAKTARLGFPNLAVFRELKAAVSN